jgi:hypothetical protein
LKDDANFRIISDMKRLNEINPEIAGCRIIKIANDNGFLRTKKMIFTSSE